MHESLFNDQASINRGDELLRLLNLAYIVDTPTPALLPPSSNTIVKRIVAGERIDMTSLETMSPDKLAGIGSRILTAYFERNQAYETDLQARQEFTTQKTHYKNECTSFLHEHRMKPISVKILPGFESLQPIAVKQPAFIKSRRKINGYLGLGLSWNSSPDVVMDVAKRQSSDAKTQYLISPFHNGQVVVSIAIGN